MLVRTLHFFWLLSVAALFVVAVVIAAGRLWLPTLAEYRAEVEALAGGILQKTVTIGRIEGAWRRQHYRTRAAGGAACHRRDPGWYRRKKLPA